MSWVSGQNARFVCCCSKSRSLTEFLLLNSRPLLILPVMVTVRPLPQEFKKSQKDREDHLGLYFLYYLRIKYSKLNYHNLHGFYLGVNHTKFRKTCFKTQL